MGQVNVHSGAGLQEVILSCGLKKKMLYLCCCGIADSSPSDDVINHSQESKTASLILLSGSECKTSHLGSCMWKRADSTFLQLSSLVLWGCFWTKEFYGLFERNYPLGNSHIFEISWPVVLFFPRHIFFLQCKNVSEVRFFSEVGFGFYFLNCPLYRGPKYGPPIQRPFSVCIHHHLECSSDVRRIKIT